MPDVMSLSPVAREQGIAEPASRQSPSGLYWNPNARSADQRHYQARCEDAREFPDALQNPFATNACLLVFEPWCRTVPELEGRFTPPLNPAEIGTHLMPLISEAVLPSAIARVAESRAKQDAGAPQGLPAGARRTAECADKLFAAIVDGGSREASDAVQELADTGEAGLDRIFCIVMPAVAARLDDAFRADTCSEADRTVGMCLLRGLLDRLSGECDMPGIFGPEVLLWAPAGEPVGIDLSLLAVQLRRSGMSVETHEGDTPAEIVTEACRCGTDAVVLAATTSNGAGIAVDVAERLASAHCTCEVIGLGEPVRAARDATPHFAATPTVVARSAADACRILRHDLVDCADGATPVREDTRQEA